MEIKNCPECNKWTGMDILIHYEYFEPEGTLRSHIECECGWNGCWSQTINIKGGTNG
jgi:hypothetical protein